MYKNNFQTTNLEIQFNDKIIPDDRIKDIRMEYEEDKWVLHVNGRHNKLLNIWAEQDIKLKETGSIVIINCEKKLIDRREKIYLYNVEVVKLLRNNQIIFDCYYSKEKGCFGHLEYLNFTPALLNKIKRTAISIWTKINTQA
jgi:hypothetical protein